MRRNEYELLPLSKTRANTIDEFFVSINLMISEISALIGHSIRFVMLVSLWHYISVLLLDGVLWVHMINFIFMSMLGFNPQVYDLGTDADLFRILAHSVTRRPIDDEGCDCIADLGMTKACKTQMQVLNHLFWVKEALNKDAVDLPSAIKFFLEILVIGTQIVSMVTWQTKLYGHKMVFLVWATVLDNFLWVPGLGAQFLFPLSRSVGAFLTGIMFLYILGDKNYFEGEKIEDEMRQKMR